MKDILDVTARIFISVIFFFEAYDSTAYFKQTKVTMTEYGITWNQDFLLIATIFGLFLGATLLLIGYRMTFGGVLLLIYWIPVTMIVHSFWNDPPEEQRLQSILFMKNLAITGALMLLMVKGSGKYSVKRLLKVTKIPKGET